MSTEWSAAQAMDRAEINNDLVELAKEGGYSTT